jgi:ribokinase
MIVRFKIKSLKYSKLIQNSKFKSMLDIITFGSATWDVFLQLESFEAIKNKKFISGQGICFNLGSKIGIKEIKFNSGGGGTNTAATFSRQGLKTAYCGAVGDDISGGTIIKELRELGVDVGFACRKREKPTNYSVILNSGEERDRTILVYRGASELLCDKDIPWEKLKEVTPKWFYLAPLSGRPAELTEKIVNFAKKNKIRIAFNPGNSQLTMPAKTLKRVLSKVDVLFLNQEEASLLTEVPYKKEKEIFKKIDEICPGIAVMTKGPQGACVSDGQYIYQARPPKIKVLDRTGAGDSFASGFISGLIKKNNIEAAIQLAIANANSCLRKIGAKNGLLEKGEKFTKVKVEKYLVSSI